MNCLEESEDDQFLKVMLHTAHGTWNITFAFLSQSSLFHYARGNESCEVIKDYDIEHGQHIWLYTENTNICMHTQIYLHTQHKAKQRAGLSAVVIKNYSGWKTASDTCERPGICLHHITWTA